MKDVKEVVFAQTCLVLGEMEAHTEWRETEIKVSIPSHQYRSDTNTNVGIDTIDIWVDRPTLKKQGDEGAVELLSFCYSQLDFQTLPTQALNLSCLRESNKEKKNWLSSVKLPFFMCAV